MELRNYKNFSVKIIDETTIDIQSENPGLELSGII
jgi:hypothetical protein